MKVVVSCDAVVERDYYLEAVETALDVIGENCELYTLVHNQGSIVGPVEQRIIHSTFLTNTTKGWSGLLKNSFLIPSASKNLFIPCSVDLIINISRGFSSGIKKCDATKQVTYLVEDINQKRRKKSLREKIFSLFVTSFQKNSLKSSDEVWVARENFLPRGYDGKFSEVLPPIKLTDYKILPDALFERDYILINIEPFDTQRVVELIAELEIAKVKFKFVGNDDHLKDLREMYEQYFFGNKCSGEMAPLLSGCNYLIDPDTTGVPTWSLKTMASGRPVFSLGNPFMDFGEGVYELPSSNYSEIFSVPKFDKSEVRGRALQFEELKFKHKLGKYLSDFI